MKALLSGVLTALLFWAPLLAPQYRINVRITSPSGWTVDDGPADEPTSYVDTSYTIPTCTEIDVGVTLTGDCKTITVDAGQNLQTALNDARRGDRIALGCDGTPTGGATFQAPSGAFIAPSKAGTGTIYITPNDDCIGLLPAVGNRVIPDDLVGGTCDRSDALYCVSGSTPATANFDVSAMPTLVGDATYPHQVLLFENGADDYVVMGFTMRPPTNEWASLLTATATNGTVDAGTADILYDRLYLHGDADGGAEEGGGRAIVFIGCDRCAVSNSYLSNFIQLDGDSQAVLVADWANVIGIYNNYLSATGENIFADMSTSGPSTQHPTDVDIRWNLIQKELDWVTLIGAGLNNYKNLYETKAGCRILIEGNIFRNSYASNGATAAAQETSLNIKEGDEDTDKYTCHHTIRKNLWQYGIGNAIKFCLAECNGANTNDGHDLAIYNNVIHVDGVAYGRGNPADGYALYQFVTNGDDVTVVNNTFLNKAGNFVGASGTNDGTTWSCIYRNNIGNEGTSDGIFSTADFAAACPGGGDYLGNVIVGGSSGSYPANQAGFPANWAAVTFENYNSGNDGGDFRLATGSAYKAACTDTLSIGTTDCGANVPVVNNAVSCVKTGACSGWTPLAPAPAPLTVRLWVPLAPPMSRFLLARPS